MDDIAEVIVIDDEDDDDEFDDYRNRARVRRTSGSSTSSGRRRVRTRQRPTAIVRERSAGRRREIERVSSDRELRRSSNAGPVIRWDTGGLSIGVLIEAGAQVLAAIQPLPPAPTATGYVGTDVGNLMVYQKALAEHAKRDEQLRTVGSLASKFFA